MRVITGLFRGRKLIAPDIKSENKFDIRPTSDMAKEGMFSAVQFEIEGRVVADLFAGTGQLGIEALSRGASKVYFVDNSPANISVLKSNLDSLKNLADSDALEKAEVVNAACVSFLKSNSVSLDIAFLDPPYERGHLQKTFAALVPRMNESGVIICEHETPLNLPEEIGEGFKIKKVYKYGKISVTIYRRG